MKKTQRAQFDWTLLTPEDRAFVEGALGFQREPDLVIGNPSYLYRWHVVPRNEAANTYLHVQVASDPDRPLHDHPWENMSVIVSGGYDELIQARPWPGGYVETKKRRKGDVVIRPAEQPHRLILPEGIPYTISLFSTGPKAKSWGFWCEVHGRNTWVDHAECVELLPDGRSIWKGPPGRTI